MKLKESNRILALIAILLLTTLGLLVFKREGYKTVKQTSTPQPQRVSTDLAQASDVEGEGIMTKEEIHLGAQSPFPGNTVVANGVVIPTGGFVVVYREGENKLFGKIIGYSEYLSPKRHETVTINTEEKLEDGDKLLIVLHADNGDGVFTSPEKDQNLIDPNKKIPLIRLNVWGR